MLAIEGEEPPAYDAELTLDGKVVGRVTSAARDGEHGIVALGFVRREVPAEATSISTAGAPRRCRAESPTPVPRYTHAFPRP